MTDQELFKMIIDTWKPDPYNEGYTALQHLNAHVKSIQVVRSSKEALKVAFEAHERAFQKAKEEFEAGLRTVRRNCYHWAVFEARDSNTAKMTQMCHHCGHVAEKIEPGKKVEI